MGKGLAGLGRGLVLHVVDRILLRRGYERHARLLRVRLQQTMVFVFIFPQDWNGITGMKPDDCLK